MDFTKKHFNRTKALSAIILASSVLLTACGEPAEPKKAPLAQYTQQGNTYLEQFQFKAAITSAKNAIAAYPEQIEGYLILAQIYLQLGQPNTSSFILKNYSNNKTPEYYFLLLESYQKNNKLISARKLIEVNASILEQQPNRLKKEQAKLLLREKNVEQALIEFKELESIDAYKVDSLIGQARVSALSEDITGAIALLNRAIDNDGKNSEALILKSYLLINSDQLVEAEKTLSEALTVLPSADLFTPERISILQALTEVLTSQGRSSEALLYSRVLADEFPEAASINQNYVEAQKQYQNKEFGLAKQTLENILKVAPSNKKALTLYGVILYTQGDIAGAQKYLSNVVDPEKDSKELTQLYAMTQLKLNNASDVLSMLDDTITSEDSEQTLTLYLLAAIDQQQFDKAKFALTKLEKLFPNSDNSALLGANYYSKITPAEHDKALSILQKGLEKHPKNSNLQTAYLEKLTFLNKNDDADKYAQQLQRGENSSIETQILIAKYNLHKKQYQQAEQIFNTILKQNNKNLNALYGLAYIKQATENWSEVQSAYRNVILFHPTELKGYQGFILSQIKLKQEMNQAHQRLPENYEPAILELVLADAYLQQRNIDQANIHIKNASQGLPSEFLPHLTQLQQKIKYQRAIVALADKDFDSARKITLDSLKNTPDNPSLLVLLAKIEIESGQLNEASKIIDQVEVILPNNPVTSIYRADIALAAKDPNKAIKLLKDKWNNTPDDKVAQKLYSTLQQQDKQQAELFLDEWQTQVPESPTVTLNKALSLQKQGDIKGALVLYEKVLEQRPYELTSLNNAAWLYFTLGDSRAEALAQRAYSLAPDNAAIVDTYGWILYKAGKVKEAKPLIQQANKLAPKNTDIENHWLEVKDL